MINLDKLKPVLEGYKEYFPQKWNVEKYKWEAVKQFQDNWNIDADNFGEMFKKATEKTANLLTSSYSYPRLMIINFANANDETTRSMFKKLFDETKDLATRVDEFQKTSEELRAMYDDGNWHNHYQNMNSISTYLWLMYPDKYYIYKYELFKEAAKELESDYMPTKRNYISNLIGGFKMYDEICDAIKADSDICDMIKNALTTSCYPDPKMKTATIDVGYYLAKYYLNEKVLSESELPDSEDTTDTIENTPSIWKISHGDFTSSQYRSLLTTFENRNVAVVHSTTRAKGRSKVPQGQRFMNDIRKGDYFYLCYGNSIRLLGQFTDDTATLNPEMQDGWYERKYKKIKDSNDESAYKGIQKWWAPNDNSTCIKVENNELDLFEDSILKPYFGMTMNELFNKDNTKFKVNPNYWWLTAKPSIWSFSNLKVGEEGNYTLYNENGNKRRIFQNFLDAKMGDIVIGYEANPVKKIVAIAQVTQASNGKEIFFKKLEGLSNPIEYKNLKEYPELKNMEFFAQPNGSLFKLTKDEYDYIIDLIREENPLNNIISSKTKYTKEDFLKEVFIDEELYDTLVDRLKYKLNIILQGAPGVGKTFIAKKLAYSIMGEKDDSRIEMVQFHQNYSYEDFIMGFRPDGSDFKLTDGIFYRFCKKAANYPDKKFFFIIDEINRGNMSKIFGELLMLIEKDYRGVQLTLPYSGLPFSIPDNIYIIGMMNTADRSLAMLDYALRRRFSFFNIVPGFNAEGFIAYQKSINNETFDSLIDQIKKLNKDISDKLGSGFQIGHSYFCGLENKLVDDDLLRAIVKYDILPMLEEYWFDDPDIYKTWKDNLSGVFDD